MQAAAQSTSSLELTEIRLGPDQFEFGFQDGNTGASSYRLESTLSLAPPVRWTDAQASILDLGGGAYRAVAPSSAEPIGIFRVVRVDSTGGETASASIDARDYLTQEGSSFSAQINFTAHYTGVIRYMVRGTGFSETGEIAVNGRTAIIPVSLPSDDDQVSGARLFTLVLVAAEPALRDGTGSRSVITFEDNDSRWTGLLQPGGVRLPLTLHAIRRSGSGLAQVVSDGAGLFPAGVYKAENYVHDTVRFEAAFPDIRLPSGSSPLGAATSFTLVLSAAADVEGSLVSPDEIHGRYSLTTSLAEQPHLNTQTTGDFTLLRQPSAPPSDKVALE